MAKAQAKEITIDDVSVTALTLVQTVRVFCTLLTGVLIFAPAPTQAANVSAEPEHPGQVHYEKVDESGRFTDHQILEDPFLPFYRRDWRTRSLPDQGPDGKSNSAVTTIMKSGPIENRLNLVFVGDGYAREEMGVYARDVERVVAKLFEQEPYKSYRSFFNVHRVDTVSIDSGVSGDPSGSRSRTALDMVFGCNGLDRLLCVNQEKALAEARRAPRADQIIALANSSRYGGAGYRTAKIATMSARSGAALELALHEMGHSLVGLSDEYDVPGDECDHGPNVASQGVEEIARLQTKWFRWLGAPGISAYRGACYSRTDYFRPTSTSKMRELGKPFYQVNLEAHIIAFYKSVRLIDEATSEGEVSAEQTLYVRLVSPADHALSITWYLNGQPLEGWRGPVLDLSKLDSALKRGRPRVSVRVVESTPSVRDENARAQLLTEQRSWVVVDQPRATNASRTW